jgi:putative flavoprotein involved in K+ transport
VPGTRARRDGGAELACALRRISPQYLELVLLPAWGPVPPEAGRWRSRDALVAYYEGYATRHRLDLQAETTVERVGRRNGAWCIQTSCGRIEAQSVVIATGKYHTPVVPNWTGKDTFTGELIHSSRYRNPGPYRDRHVLVVGPGASGFEIATQLAKGGAASSRLSIRTPPHIIHRDIGPLPSDFFAVISRWVPVRVVDRVGDLIRRITIGDLSAFGLPAPPDGIYSRVKRTGMIPTIDGPYVEAVKELQVEVGSAVEGFQDETVVLSDGRRLEP